MNREELSKLVRDYARVTPDGAKLGDETVRSVCVDIEKAAFESMSIHEIADFIKAQFPEYEWHNWSHLTITIEVPREADKEIFSMCMVEKHSRDEARDLIFALKVTPMGLISSVISGRTVDEAILFYPDRTYREPDSIWIRALDNLEVRALDPNKVALITK